MYTTYMGIPQLWLAGAHLPRSTQTDAPLCSPGISSSEDSMPFSSNMSTTHLISHIHERYTALQWFLLHFHCLLYICML